MSDFVRASLEFIAPPLSAQQVTDLWLALQKKEAAELAYRHQFYAAESTEPSDPLSPDERKLYEMLTRRLLFDSSIAAIVESGDPVPTPNPPEITSR